MILISLFGWLGVSSRYAVDVLLANGNGGFPIATLLVNLAGCFLAGTIYALSTPSSLQTGLLVGFCGGFTTFSAYALQTLVLFERGKVLPAIAYLLGSPLLGLLAASLPVFVLRKILL